ncbi:MAG: DNA adenine methylase [Gemmataceae bacterium]
MAVSFSPLRYPGGKQILARILSHLIRLNGLEGGVYVEPYAGGAGAALSLLYGEHVRQVIINDADVRIFAFWHSVLNRTKQLVELIQETPLSVAEWRKQRETYLRPKRNSLLRVGFAAFYLNRCNRSGIIANGGLIGGLQQKGQWKLDARFNRSDLARRVERVAGYGDRIQVYNLDAMALLKQEIPKPGLVGRSFVYLDPPYYSKGSQLYLNHYVPNDHIELSRFLHSAQFTWALSYDNVPAIRKLYSDFRQISFNLGYSARAWRIGKELLVVPPQVAFPIAWPKKIPDQFITSADRLPRALPAKAAKMKNRRRRTRH